jgi:hypothetical protein
MSGSSSSPPAGTHRLLDEPLGLTVYSLPAPQEAVPADGRRTRSGRLKMLLVLAVCAAPVIASYLSYYVLHPQGQAGFGQLVEQRPLPALTATDLRGGAVALPSLKGQWLLVSVAGGACDSGCEKNLYWQRQLREALGKDKDRVDWVWLVSDAQPVRPEVAKAVQQATVLRVPEASLAGWLAPGRGHRLEDHLYLVDPLGNWMMRFPANLDLAGAAKARRDLERLLRASASWDQPGRSSAP